MLMNSDSSKPKPESRISAEEAQRAIYIDFEGFEEQSPAILGITIEGGFRQIVLDERLGPAATAKGLAVAPLDMVADKLVEIGSKESRYIVGYSQHEKNVVREYAGLDLSGMYRDARMIAKRWKAICHRDEPIDGRGLKDFMKFAGYAVPAYFGVQKATSRLKAVIDMLAKRQDFSALTPVVKAKWTKLLDYNRSDCEGMRRLVIQAAGELEQRQKA